MVRIIDGCDCNLFFGCWLGKLFDCYDFVLV